MQRRYCARHEIVPDWGRACDRRQGIYSWFSCLALDDFENVGAGFDVHRQFSLGAADSIETRSVARVYPCQVVGNDDDETVIALVTAEAFEALPQAHRIDVI